MTLLHPILHFFGLAYLLFAIALICALALQKRPTPPLMLLLLVALCGGCATTPLSSPHYPPAIQAQCERAYGEGRAQYVHRYGQPAISPMWQVRMERGQKWGNQWAIMNGGQLCGGKTMGVYTVIGCGPNGEVNEGDLAHESLEAWCQINGNGAH